MNKPQDRTANALRIKLRASAILRVHQVASILGLSCRTVRYLALRGKLRGYKTGPRLWAFHGCDVEEYVKKHPRPWELGEFCRCSAQGF